MALYKHGNGLEESQDGAFDITYSPGSAAPYPGIYRCTNCGEEIAIEGGNSLPRQNHRHHDLSIGLVAWQLLVYPVEHG